jgi:hypothetical protein
MNMCGVPMVAKMAVLEVAVAAGVAFLIAWAFGW